MITIKTTQLSQVDPTAIGNAIAEARSIEQAAFFNEMARVFSKFSAPEIQMKNMKEHMSQDARLFLVRLADCL